MRAVRLVVAAGREKALLRRHPWIFSGAIKRVEGKPKEGEVVDVVLPTGEWVATGHYQSGSIICKVLTYDRAEAALLRTDERQFFENRLRSAIAFRQRLGFWETTQTNVFRLVHAEGDNLPGLVCDWYNGVLVMQAHSVGMHRELPLLTDIARSLLGERLQAVFDKSAATCPSSPDEDVLQDGYLWGIEPECWEVEENGYRLYINFFEGQKTGFFVDQRENRALVETLAKGSRLLNCFGYTGGFSLAALKGGARQVETVDVSRKAIEMCERNVALNFGSDARHRGVVADVLHYLAKPECASGAFDFIILDPPAFAKSHAQQKQGLKGYRAINQRAMEVLPKGGLLMTFSCSQAVGLDDFKTMVFTAAINARRQVRIVRQLPHAADHPVSIYHPEGEYLKGLLLQVE